MSAALAAGARPSVCPAWATPENLAKAVQGQENFNPFTVFGEAPPEVVLSEVYDERHYTHASVYTRASHPAICRLVSGRKQPESSALDNAATHGREERHEDEKRDKLRQTQEKLRDQVARGEISAEEAQKRWVRVLQETSDKEEQDPRKEWKAFQEELVRHGFSGKLDGKAFKEKLLPALEAWWRGQCEVELDWRHDPLTSEECTWYIEAMGAVVDATDVISCKQACFCPTPPPYQPWAWTDSRFRLRQKAEQERAALQMKRANEREKKETRCNSQGGTRGGAGRRGRRTGAKEAEEPIDGVEEKGSTLHYSGEVEDDDPGRDKGKRQRCPAGQGRGAEQHTQHENVCTSWYSTEVSQAEATDGKPRGDTPSEGSPITPQVRLGVRGSLRVITRRGQIMREEVEGAGDADTRPCKRQKGGKTKAKCSGRDFQTSDTETTTTAGDTAAGWLSNLDERDHLSVLQGTVAPTDCGTELPTPAATHTLVASSSSRAYHWNTPIKGIRSTLERRAVAERDLPNPVDAPLPGGILQKTSEQKDSQMPNESAAGSTWSDELATGVCQTDLRAGVMEQVNHQLSAYCGELKSALRSSTLGTQGGKLTRGLCGQNLLSAPLPASSTTGRSAHPSSECNSETASSRNIDLTARDAWRRNPFSRQLASVPRARLSIDRVYGGRHDAGRAVYQGLSLFPQTQQVGCWGISGVGPMRRRSKGRAVTGGR